MGSSPINPGARPELPGSTPPAKAEEWQSGSIPNVVSFLFRNVAPPSPLYIQRDDQLQVYAFTSIAGDVLTVTARLLLADENRITTIQFQVTLGAAYSAIGTQRALAEGYLLSLTVLSASATQSGQTHVTMLISRGQETIPPQVPGQILFSGYVTDRFLGAWPGGLFMQPTDGPGNPRVITIANPAAGADWTQTVQVVTNWELVCFNAVLTTSAAVANRQPQLILDDGATAYFTGPPVSSLVASTTNTVSGAQTSGPASVITTDLMLPIPPRNFLRGGDRIRVVTAGIQAADQWSAIRLLVREWLQI